MSLQRSSVKKRRRKTSKRYVKKKRTRQRSSKVRMTYPKVLYSSVPESAVPYSQVAHSAEQTLVPSTFPVDYKSTFSTELANAKSKLNPIPNPVSSLYSPSNTSKFSKSTVPKLTDTDFDNLMNIPKSITSRRRAMSLTTHLIPTGEDYKPDTSLYVNFMAKATKAHVEELAKQCHSAYPAISQKLYHVALQRCIRFYTGDGYSLMNKYLLNRQTKLQRQAYQSGGQNQKVSDDTIAYNPHSTRALVCTRVLSYLCNSYRLKQPLVVFRGLVDRRFNEIKRLNKYELQNFFSMQDRKGHRIPFVGQSMQVGSIFSNTSFMSTSLDRNVSEGFLDDNGCCMFQITLPAGFPCFYLTPFSKFEGEYEVLVSPCCQFVVTRFEPATNTYYLKPLWSLMTDIVSTWHILESILIQTKSLDGRQMYSKSWQKISSQLIHCLILIGLNTI